MRDFSLSIGRRLNGGFALVLAMCAALAVVAWLRLGKLGDVVADINDSWVVSIVQLNEINDALAEVRRSELRAVLGTDPERLALEDAVRVKQFERMATATKPYEATGISGPPEQKVYDEFRAALRAYQASWTTLRPMIRAAAAERQQAAVYVTGPSEELYHRMQTALQADIAYNVQGIRVRRADANDALSSGVLIIFGTLGAIVVVSAFFGHTITRSIVNPVLAAIGMARNIASGDLTQTVDTSRRDETGRLMSALNDMQSSLRTTLGDIQRAADQVGSASAQIATGNGDLSERTERQASNLQQTAAAIEELTGAVAQSTDSTRQANQLAMTATRLAEQGGSVVGRVVDTMNGISQSSKRIGDIISVIDGIAFQTNILALNAAVEAARAGEQGRGFAVVATEVRTLAQRSAQAAKEIKALIQDSVERVESGGALVQQAGGTMSEIVAAIGNVTELIATVNAAATQQHGGIQSVNAAVAELDQGTQQNAALVEESAAAAMSLRDQAGQLNATVQKFKLAVA